MNADDLKKLTTESLKQLASMLDEGQIDRLTSLLTTMARFHRYSLHNVCLIVAQRPAATRVAGFHTWRTLGRFVRKGEKGIAIMAPIIARRRDDANEEQPRTIVGFRAAYVFDVEQTDGAPLPQPPEIGGDPAIDPLAANTNGAISKLHVLETACGAGIVDRVHAHSEVARRLPRCHPDCLSHDLPFCDGSHDVSFRLRRRCQTE
jgi:antirestriction factor ArdC-like protein